jgi:quinol monooxygenase YgiN
MTTISKKNQYITFINVFKVDPSKQEELIDILTKGTNNTVRFQDGFVSSVLHRSLDGTKVTMYAQWKSQELYNKMRDNVQAGEIFRDAIAIAQFDGGQYEVVEEFEFSR